jgi:hypothetical protein
MSRTLLREILDALLRIGLHHPGNEKGVPMKKGFVLVCIFLAVGGSMFADEYFLHFSGLAFQGVGLIKLPEFGLVFRGSDSNGNDPEKNLLICPVDFRFSYAILRSMTIRYYDNDPGRHWRIRLMRMSIDTGVPEVQAEWNSALLGESGWTKIDGFIYKNEIDNNQYSYWIEALLFGPNANVFPSGYNLALQSIRISYATPWDTIIR